jgi:LCP family protein required for cell wall assembly
VLSDDFFFLIIDDEIFYNVFYLERGGHMAAETQKKKKKRKLRRRPGWLAALISIAAVAAAAYFIFELVWLDLFPFYLVLPVSLIVLVLLALILVLWWGKARVPATRLLGGLIASALAVSCVMGGYYINKTAAVFSNITNLTDKIVNTTSLVVKSDSAAEDEASLAGQTVGVLSGSEDGLVQAKAQLSEDVNVMYKTYSGIFPLIDALNDGEVAAILFPESSRDIVHEEDGYFEFNTDTKVLTQMVTYTDRTDTDENKPDAVSNITEDAFTVLISGNDSYGSLNEYSRSDVNMLVTINPKTKTVLITSIPRDAYVHFTCKKDSTACTSYYGAGMEFEDKLTHTGLHGVATTESTIEDYLDIEINYTVRVNFSSLVNLVDALGGIDVYVEEGLEVDTFYANGTKGVDAGWNHLEGERALAFARERHAYTDGDNQRIKNQQIVMSALINKVISPEIFVRYPALMDAVGIAFETNMPADQIKQFLRYEIINRPDWTILSYAVAGDAGYEYSGELGTYASVTIPYDWMVEAAQTAIKMVEEGDSAEEVQIYVEKYTLASAGSFSTEEQQAEIAAATGQSLYEEEEYSGYGYETYADDDWYQPDVYGWTQGNEGLGY